VSNLSTKQEISRGSGRKQLSVPNTRELGSTLHGWLNTPQEMTEEESWRFDESWTAMIAYMAEMNVPGEG
jgi:hypothetical protein